MKKSFKDSYLDFWRNAFVMKGRTRRRDYWIPVVVNGLLSGLINGVAGGITGPAAYDENTTLTEILLAPDMIIMWILSLILLIPSVTLLARRLQDIGINGRWSFVYNTLPFIWLLGCLLTIASGTDAVMSAGVAIFLIGGLIIGATAVVVLILTLLDSQAYTNQYGPDPKKDER